MHLVNHGHAPPKILKFYVVNSFIESIQEFQLGCLSE